MDMDMKKDLDERFENVDMLFLASILDPVTRSWACNKKGKAYVKEELMKAMKGVAEQATRVSQLR